MTWLICQIISIEATMRNVKYKNNWTTATMAMMTFSNLWQKHAGKRGRPQDYNDPLKDQIDH